MSRPAVLKIDILADAKGVGQGVADAESKLGKLGKVGGVIGAAVAGGLAVAGAAVVGLGVATLGAASRAEQSAGAIASVFGDAAAQVEGYAQTSATQLGLAGSSYRELASVVGSQLKNMGQSQVEAAGSSDQLIRLGADLAATFGGDVSTAVEAVGSLLRGERDPIERYGVSINQAAIDARLAADGLSGLTGEARKQAEAQATLALLTEQTAGAQGAFARESGTAAGASAILGAKVEDVKARIGEGLLPIAASLATTLADDVLPSVENVGTELIGKLAPSLATAAAFITERVVPGALVLGARFRSDVLPALTSVAQFIVQRVVPAAVSLFGWYAEKIAPALAGAVASAFRGVQSAIATVTSALDRNEPALRTLATVLGNVVSFVVNRVLPVVGSQLGAAFSTAGTIISGVIGTVSAVVRAFERVADAVRDAKAAVSNFRLPNLGGFFAGSALVTVGAPQLVGGTPGLAPLGSLATASAGTADAGRLLAGAAASGRGLVVVDRSDRRVSVRVDGALDPPAVAAQLRRLLDDAAVRSGARPAYGGAA